MKILVIEDNPADMEMIREYLLEHREFDLIHERTLSDGICRLSRGGIDSILLDLGLPDSHGIETVRTVRRTHPELPIIVLTGLDDSEIGVQALQEGAQDYLVKNQMDGHSLTRSIQYAYERNRIEKELIRKNEELAASEEKYRTIVETANEGIWVMNPDRITTYVNRRMAEMLGYSPDEMIGKSAMNCLDEKGKDLPDQDLIERNEGKSHELKLYRRDGSILWAHINAQPLFGTDGTFLGTLSMLSDITESKKAEYKLKEYAASLKRSNEDLERFAYAASHDLQEPLRNVVSFSQLLARRYQGKLDTDADDYIGYIVEGGKRMQALVNDLLEYSRVTTRAEPFQATDCTEILDEVLQNLFITIRESKAVIDSTPLPTVNGDPVQLGLVFQNLINNAIKFRRDVRPHIRISAEKTDDRWQFAVRDNGIGIDSAFYTRIFEIFQRLHTRDKYPGTGIGLAIVKKIIERHGGQIWVESEVGKGSTFYFTVPVANYHPLTPMPHNVQR